MTRKQLHRQQAQYHKQCECVDTFITGTFSFVALASILVALGSLINNWEIITFIFWG